LIYQNKTAVGSALIGQSFDRKDLFWSRPSGTPDYPYNALSSAGSNLGPTNPKLISEIKSRIEFLKENGLKLPIPSDLVMGSGSGLDPDITPESAMAQIPRISKVTNIPVETLKELVMSNIEPRDFGFLGAERVNVLKLNLKLLELEKKYAR
ncbi:MAG: potassium-transporting ATPase subunit C, partial [Thermodesulfobium narugense]